MSGMSLFDGEEVFFPLGQADAVAAREQAYTNVVGRRNEKSYRPKAPEAKLYTQFASFRVCLIYLFFSRPDNKGRKSRYIVRRIGQSKRMKLVRFPSIWSVRSLLHYICSLSPSLCDFRPALSYVTWR